MESKFFGCHSVRLRQSDSLLEFCNSFKPARFVIRLALTKGLKTENGDQTIKHLKKVKV